MNPSFAPIPFRTPQKIKALAQRDLILPREPYYPLKPVPRYIAKNHRQQQYMHVHGFGSWMVDVAFFANKGQLIQASEEHPELLEQERTQGKHIDAVLICIHCNSRYVHARIIPNQQAATIFNVLREVIQLGFPCDTIISDADAHIASAVRSFARIRHIVYNMSEASTVQHSSLAIIDRFTRTLRDMLFTADVAINAHTLNYLIDMYNKTPHSTLTKIMGFEVTPLEMIKHVPVQEEFIRRVQSINVRKEPALSHAFNVGDEVYVYQPRQPFIKRRNTVEDYPYRVESVSGGRYALVNTRNPHRRIERPRSYLVNPRH